MEQAIQDFISSKRIAVVGCSRNGRKFGNSAYKELKKKGYQVFAVHPTEEEIESDKCFPNLTSLQGAVDSVLISVSPENVESILKEASLAGIKNVWIQQGAESKKAIEVASRLGLNFVSKKCILMYALPVNSIHKFHRGVTKIFGRL
jgi:uncharacterized protein